MQLDFVNLFVKSYFVLQIPVFVCLLLFFLFVCCFFLISGRLVRSQVRSWPERGRESKPLPPSSQKSVLWCLN